LNAGASRHWSGLGIFGVGPQLNSSLAYGYAEVADVLGLSGAQTALFGGEAVDATSVLVRETLYGDATLDGAVDFNDLVRVAQTYNTTLSATTHGWWSHGDFTFDGVCDFNDLVKFAQNYNAAVPTTVPAAGNSQFAHDLAAAFAMVPEPGPGLLAAAVGILATRRRRARR
jgi:hypothetical protein